MIAKPAGLDHADSPRGGEILTLSRDQVAPVLRQLAHKGYRIGRVSAAGQLSARFTGFSGAPPTFTESLRFKEPSSLIRDLQRERLADGRMRRVSHGTIEIDNSVAATGEDLQPHSNLPLMDRHRIVLTVPDILARGCPIRVAASQEQRLREVALGAENRGAEAEVVLDASRSKVRRNGSEPVDDLTGSTR